MAKPMNRAFLALGLYWCTLTGIDALVNRAPPAVAQKTPTPTAADVAALHKQLGAVAGNLEKMLSAKDGALAHAKVGPTMKVFLKELQAVLKATADNAVAPAVAMAKLSAAKQSLAGLMSDLSARQENIMKEDNAQRESLLLGVLMSKQKETMERQLEILKDEDFAGLEVTKALLAKHDAKTALYKQVAAYLDAHPKRKAAPMVKPEDPKMKMAAVLEKHLATLEHEYQTRERLHKKKVLGFAARLKKADKKETHVVHILQKREERQFKKWAAVRKHDISAMKDAVEGVKKGDMKAIARARDALTNSLKAMKAQTGGFLYLLQMGHKLMKRDCPYCVAQCVDKCHNDGKPYVTCLTDCADAGK